MIAGLEKILCPDMVKLVTEHFKTCEQCQNSIDSLYAAFPMLHLLMPKDEMRKLVMKGLDNGSH